MGMDSLPSTLSALVEREAENSRRIAETRATLERLETENKRIADALALLKEIGAIPADAKVGDATPKTLPDMIFAAIEQNGSPQTGGEILEFIKANWQPEMDPNYVRPTLWRLAKNNRLKKRGDRYDLP